LKGGGSWRGGSSEEKETEGDGRGGGADRGDCLEHLLLVFLFV
jgi:hypothetical protein